MMRGLRAFLALVLLAAISGIAIFLITSSDRLTGADRGGWRRPSPHLPGNWNAVAQPEALSGEQRAEMKQLQALGYVSGSQPGSGLRGVVKHDPQRAHPGYNLVVSGHAPEAVLMDMEGRIVHRWRKRFTDVFSGRDADVRAAHRLPHWRRAFLLADGSLIAIFAAKGMAKIDRSSRLVWAQPAEIHHDAHVLPSGEIYTLARRVRLLPRAHPERPVAEDLIAVLDGATGAIKRQLSIIEALERSPYRDLWDRRRQRGGDVLHTNSITVLDGGTPAFAPGSVLVSSRNLNALVVVDMTAGRAIWAHSGPYRRQHDPRPLPGGELALFDNLGRRTRSRILAVDPIRGGSRVLYDGGRENPFFSRDCGAVHLLPNGNLLIVATQEGRAFEVDPGGRVVWDFYNPQRAGEGGMFVASLFDVVRVGLDTTRGWLPAAGRSEAR